MHTGTTSYQNGGGDQTTQYSAGDTQYASGSGTAAGGTSYSGRASRSVLNSLHNRLIKPPSIQARASSKPSAPIDDTA